MQALVLDAGRDSLWLVGRWLSVVQAQQEGMPVRGRASTVGAEEAPRPPRKTQPAAKGAQVQALLQRRPVPHRMDLKGGGG